MLVKHSISIRGHKTSYSLEDEFYRELCQIAKSQGNTVSSLVVAIDDQRDPATNLSSAIRIFVLSQIKTQSRAAKSH